MQRVIMVMMWIPPLYPILLIGVGIHSMYWWGRMTVELFRDYPRQSIAVAAVLAIIVVAAIGQRQ
jgi:hypothetical protein